jgi:hypothetical protein
VQHGFGATAAGVPLVVAGLTWSAGSWWAGRDRAARDPHRVRMVRVAFGFIAVSAASTAIVAASSVPGWLMYLTWGLGGVGAGIAMSSTDVLLLRYTSDTDRGADSAALQLSDAVTSALTIGLAGALVATAARGALGYGAALTLLDLTMAGIAVVGMCVAGQARPAVTNHMSRISTPNVGERRLLV